MCVCMYVCVYIYGRIGEWVTALAGCLNRGLDDVPAIITAFLQIVIPWSFGGGVLMSLCVQPDMKVRWGISSSHLWSACVCILYVSLCRPPSRRRWIWARWWGWRAPSSHSRLCACTICTTQPPSIAGCSCCQRYARETCVCEGGDVVVSE